MGKALLGVNLRTEAPALTSAVMAALDHIVQGVKSPDLLPGFIPTPERRRFRQAMQTLDRAVQEIIQAHKNPAERPGGAGSSLLAAMLRAQDGESPDDRPAGTR